MVAEGYPGAPEAVIETIASDTFLKGVENKRAALTAMDKDPTTLESALQMVKAAVHNQRLILGARKPEVRKVRFAEDLSSDEEDSGIQVRTVQAEGRMDKVEREMGKLKLDMQEANKTKIEQQGCVCTILIAK